jgi:hypothetical protein
VPERITPGEGTMAASRHGVENKLTVREGRPTSRIAADGQDVVDQRVDQAGEQAEIARSAEYQQQASQDERAGTPSVRFWDSWSRRAGAFCALLAGLLTLATRIWPVAPPQSHGGSSVLWVLPSVLLGIAYLCGFFLADRYWKTARVVLIVAAVMHVLIGFMAGTAVDAQAEGAGIRAMLFDLAPAALALIAVFLIAPPPTTKATLVT